MSMSFNGPIDWSDWRPNEQALEAARAKKEEAELDARVKQLDEHMNQLDNQMKELANQMKELDSELSSMNTQKTHLESKQGFNARLIILDDAIKKKSIEYDKLMTLTKEVLSQRQMIDAQKQNLLLRNHERLRRIEEARLDKLKARNDDQSHYSNQQAEVNDKIRREKLDKAREDYDKELQKYIKAVKYARGHDKSWWWRWAVPSSPFGEKIPEWQLTGNEDETEIKRKCSLLVAENTQYYHPSEAEVPLHLPPPRAKSPPPHGRGGKSKRIIKSKSKRSKKTLRRSTRRH